MPDRLKQMPGWKRSNEYDQNKNICALVAIIFKKYEITVMRTGYNRNTGRKTLQSETFKRFKESEKSKQEGSDASK